MPVRDRGATGSRRNSGLELGYSWIPLGKEDQTSRADLGEGHVLSSAHHADVVIVGAGVSGLAAAHHLIAAGVSVTVLEAADDPGGRMATEVTAEGFRLDRLGQLLNTSHRELDRTPGLEDLVLRPYRGPASN